MELKADLVRSHGVEGGQYHKWKIRYKIPLTRAYCVRFTSVGKELSVVGVQHTTDAKSLVFRFIRKKVDARRVDIVAIEGIPHKLGVSPSLLHFQGEGRYAADLASAQRIPFIGVEPTDDELLKALSRAFDVRDVCGYHFLRMHKYFYSTMKATQQQFNADFERQELPELIRTLGRVVFDGSRWFRDRFGKPFRYGKNLEHSAPHKTSKIITRRISYLNSVLRDQFMLRSLNALLVRYPRVLVVVGENHVYAQLPALENAFGGFTIEVAKNRHR